MAETSTDEAEWQHAVAGVLKGASFEETLTTRTADGIRLAPVYSRKAGTGPIAGRAAATPWTIVQRVDHPDLSAANNLLLEDLEGGTGGLTLVTAGSPFANGFGVSITSAGDLKRLFAHVQLNLISLRLDAGAQTPDIARWLGEIEGASIHYGYDPVSQLATQGVLPPAWQGASRALAGHRQNGTALTADGRALHEAGATPAVELAGVVSAGLVYLRTLEDSGTHLEEARQCLGFSLAADQDVFTTLAKTRALRLLWQRVETLCNLAPTPIHLHSETAWRMLSRRDPATNMLRNGLATAAAGLGGADSVTTLPYSSANGLPDSHARRIARNCQHVLIAEANLHRIADPAAGSGGFEAMTLTLCEAAWQQFQALERRGGIIEALKTGWLQTEIDRLHQPTGIIVGANAFVLKEEAPAAILLALKENHSQAPPPALLRHREALPFEAAS